MPHILLALLVAVCTAVTVYIDRGADAAHDIPTSVLKNMEIPVAEAEEPGVLLQHEGFTVWFNPQTGTPRWVAWRLDKEKLVERESRSNHFEPDPDLPDQWAVTTNDYKHSGWDRGHMCPAADNRWHWKAMRQCFYMSNICPQNRNLNAGDWKELEDNCRSWAREEPVYIVCGPIYNNGESHPRVIGKEHQVMVPDAFFKVVLTGLQSGKPRAAGFVFENKAGDKPRSAYLRTVDEVEQLTGLDFFSQLPSATEARIERQSNPEHWN